MKEMLQKKIELANKLGERLVREGIDVVVDQVTGKITLKSENETSTDLSTE